MEKIIKKGYVKYDMLKLSQIQDTLIDGFSYHMFQQIY